MEQTRFSAAGSFELKSPTTCKRVFLVEMQQVVPWNELEVIIAPYAKQSGPKGGCSPFAVSVAGHLRTGGLEEAEIQTNWPEIRTLNRRFI